LKKRRDWPTSAELTKYLSTFKPSELLAKHADLMMKVQYYMMRDDFTKADVYRHRAESVVLHFEKYVDT
jgi:hypothetical protein